MSHITTEALINRFRELHRLSLAEYDSYEELYNDYVVTGCRLLGLSVGIVSRVEEETYTVQAVTPSHAGMSVGQEFSVEDTYCVWVVQNARTVAHSKVAADEHRATHPVYRTTQAYISTPIWVNGDIYGTLNFSDSQPRSLPFSEEDHEPIELMALGLGQTLERDHAEQRRTLSAARLHEMVELFESAFQCATIGLALVSPQGRWLRVNNALCEITGYSAEDLLIIDFQTITHPEDLNADLHYLQEMLEGSRNTYQMDKRYFHKNGHIIWIKLSVSLVHDEEGNPKYFISQIQDITAQKAAMDEVIQKQRQLEIANRRLEELSTRDSLTQVLNRRAFDERLVEERHRSARSGSPLSILLLDVDHFKQYNDEFAHLAGDEAIKAVARVLSIQCRLTDVVARYGGEEFAVVLPNTDATACLLVAERVRLAVSEVRDVKRALTVSIGSTTVAPEKIDLVGLDNNALLACADKALYQAKNSGRDRVQQLKLLR